MADNTELHRRFQKAYLESDPTRRKELLQTDENLIIDWDEIQRFVTTRWVRI